MSDLDLEQVAFALLQDAKLLSVARPEQLALQRDWLIEAREELNAAIAKTERVAA